MNRFRNISWTTIILVCIFCFPAGVVLAILKETTPKIRSKRKRNKKRVNALKVWGWILTVIGAICIIPAVTENIQDIWVGIVIAAGGIAMLVAAYIKEGQHRKFDEYLNVIGLQNITKLDSICAIMRRSRKQVVADLELMMKKGYFDDCYIDHSKGVFVLPQVFSAPPVAQKRKHSYAAKCPNCGANVIVTNGEVVRCEYCGTPL